ncbi:MAG: helix-turn-helix transcriptional regulator [Alphaproteobacteria bacterium]
MVSKKNTHLQNLIAQLKERRLALGLKSFEVADALGQKQSWYSRFETGKVDVRVSTLESVANELGFTLVLQEKDDSE